jgi:orotate phosphoribosyltransferase
MSECQCPIDGYPRLCGRHGIVKTAHWRMLCQTKPAYFALWEEGKGPGQNASTLVDPTWQPPDDWDVSQPSRGLGDVVAKVTTKLGIKPCGGCKKRQRRLNQLVPFKRTKATSRARPFTFERGVCPEYVSTQQRVIDAYRLASKLPADTSLLIGVARSGLTVANLIAERLHLPVVILRPKRDMIEEGEGWRLRERSVNGHGGTVVLIDDNVLTGNSLTEDAPLARKAYPNLVTAALYVSPNAKARPDIFVRELRWPHVLEWNLFNSVLSPHIATDLDGILCVDPPALPEGPEYERWLENAVPLYVPRRVAVPLIVTARRERNRPQTEAWLRRHGIAWNELVMSPHETYAEAARAGIAAWKAEHVRRFFNRRHGIKPPLYVESDPAQAKAIAAAAGGYVVCPAAGRVFAPNGESAGSGSQPLFPPIEKRNLIYHVYAPRGNDEWKANLDKLRAHRNAFNGRIVIAAVRGDGTVPMEEVAQYLGWPGVEWLEVDNSLKSEASSLPILLERIQSTAGNEATFFGHTKGVSPAGDPRGARRWRNAMYHYLLGEWRECMEALRGAAAVGTTRIKWDNGSVFKWPTGLKHGRWQFAGTFFWFRHDEVFTRDWNSVPRDRYGAEAWLGGVLPVELSATMFQPFDDQFPAAWPYDPSLYPEEFDQ